MKKIFIGCNLVAALFFSAACQDRNDSSLKQKKQILKSQPTVQLKDVNEGEKLARNSKINDTPKDNAPASTNIFFSTNIENPSEQKSFNCDDQVFAIIKFANHQPKLHQINISWKDPNGEEREKNSFPFFVAEKETLAWASLKLHRSVGAGLLQWVNPAAGMEEFIGTWSVDVSVENLLNKTLNFEVLC